MHIALAVMLMIYAVPLAYLVWLAQQQHKHPEARGQNKPDIAKKR
jgi:hypothetical protein